MTYKLKVQFPEMIRIFVNDEEGAIKLQFIYGLAYLCHLLKF